MTSSPLRNPTNTSPNTNLIPDGQLMNKDYTAMMTKSGYRTPIISSSRFYLTVTITLSPVIMVKTRHWILSEGIIHGLMSACLSRTIVSLARLALGPKHRDINHMVISDNFQSRTSPGTQSPWTSSNNYHPPKDSQLS